MRFISHYLAAFLLCATPAVIHAQSIAYKLMGATRNGQGVSQDPGLRPNERMVATFDQLGGLSPDHDHSSNFGFYTGDHPGVALAPQGDHGQYAAIGAGGRMAFDLRQFSSDGTHIASVSVDVGSIDAYNFIEILGLTSDGNVNYENPLFTLSGQQIVAAGGRDGRLTFGFDDAVHIGGIMFGSNGIAFEFDSLAISTDPARGATLLTPQVPEPASWELMLGGFGIVGSALRMQRRRMAYLTR
jgi:PEP-CTERM motif